ncbi:MAG TPA: glycosyl hydrolase family 8 [Ramlibacter sp.]|nr:glycosyl hydrolase family 8 [Ramlibacter sp.]
MKRRDFSKFAANLVALSGSGSAALALTGCGGGGDVEGETALAAEADTSTSSAALAGAKRAPVTTTSGVSYPFGSRLTQYVAGIKPSASTTVMDTALKAQYTAWKAARVVSAGNIVSGGFTVKFSDANYATVSEGMGYGMLLAVIFAGHDAQARQLFDGLLAVVRARPAWAVSQYDPNGKYLMDWRLHSNGASAGDGWNAMDGDLDIALALQMAHKQWGSTGTWNYLQEAKNTIGALKSWNMKADGATKGLPSPNNNRTSDYMLGHFRAFKAATGDGLWDLAVNRAHALIDRMQTVYSAGVGLVPDFVINTHTATPSPSTGYIGDGNDKEGYFWWNACRNPWRWSTDYVMSGDARSAMVTARIIDFFKAKSGGDPYKIGTGYALDGTQLTGGNSAAYHGPICAGACVDARFQGFLDTMWTWNATHLTTGYYDGEIQLLSLVVASGNWWTPAAPGTTVPSQPSTPTEPTQPTTPVVTGNILSNGDFANGMTDWNNWGNAQVLGTVLNVGTAAGGAAQDIYSKLVPGKTYQLSGTACISAAAEGVFVGVKLMDAYGGMLVNQVVLCNSVAPVSGAMTFVAPQGATSGYVFIWKNTNAAVGLVDSLSLVQLG